MPPVIPNPSAIKSFATQAAFERWLKANHAKAPELWLKIHKKNSGLKTVTYAEALDVALCWGWIDGLKKSFDENSFLQRFTPRRGKSVWSKINTRHIARLTAEGRMQPQGQAHVDAAKADGRWDAAYHAQREMTLPDDLVEAINRNRKAQARLETLNRQYRFALAYRVRSAKRDETRQQRIKDFVRKLASGEPLFPQAAKTPAKTPAKSTAKSLASPASSAKSPARTPVKRVNPTKGAKRAKGT